MLKTGASNYKVYVGLSGGVDSAVSAALLQQQGYDVTGAFIRIAIDGYPCTAGEDKVEAMRVAAHLKIPFADIDLSDAYKKAVFDFSVAQFARGITPNPDALCNREIKFGLFYDWAMAAGADYVATGHYAQTKDGLLYAGADEGKDQSYFLWAVPQARLRKTLFPIGHMRKSQVRELAKSFGLPNAARKDSQGLCFLGPVSIHDMLQRELALAPGDVLDEAGAVVGRHDGAAAYTLGQRHGYTLDARQANTAPHFVIAKDMARNTITISESRYPRAAAATRLTLHDINWIGEAPDGAYTARFRYRQKLIPARKEGGAVMLEEPQYVPLGQSLVLYDRDRCVGGGSIADAVILS